jgi:acetyl esterase/lipase
VKDADPENDPFLSPAVTPDSILQKYPSVRLLMSGNDPLRDESFKFVLKLAKLKKDIKFVEYQMFPHAFLNFDIPIAGISECEKPIKKGAQWLKEFAEKGLGEMQ